MTLLSTLISDLIKTELALLNYSIFPQGAIARESLQARQARLQEEIDRWSCICRESEAGKK